MSDHVLIVNARAKGISVSIICTIRNVTKRRRANPRNIEWRNLLLTYRLLPVPGDGYLVPSTRLDSFAEHNCDRSRKYFYARGGRTPRLASLANRISAGETFPVVKKRSISCLLCAGSASQRKESVSTGVTIYYMYICRYFSDTVNSRKKKKFF
ncbi:hypothetical protein PUN28_005192 [Cardiocondyla obscurior]|uniref:Uncharacterized protein n=1 Tax=Cardiocondyla obscurior TaxID=286306 RepID=A0AAW2GGG6_9HYME